MRPHFRLKKITACPDWHKRRFRLNRAEMTNPHTVIQEFFDRYDLTNIRISMKQWLDDALRGDTEAASHVYTHENVEKLIEATWVIWQQRNQAEADEQIEKDPDNKHDETEMDGEDDDMEERR